MSYPVRLSFIFVPLVSFGLFFGLINSMRSLAQQEPVDRDDDAQHHIVILIDNSTSMADSASDVAAEFTRDLIRYAQAFQSDTISIGTAFFAFKLHKEQDVLSIDVWDEDNIEIITPVGCGTGQTDANPCYGTKRIDAMRWAANEQLATCWNDQRDSDCTILLFTDGRYEPVPGRVDPEAEVKEWLTTLLVTTTEPSVIPVIFTRPGSPIGIWPEWAGENLVQKPIEVGASIAGPGLRQFYQQTLDRVGLSLQGAQLRFISSALREQDEFKPRARPDLITSTLDLVLSGNITPTFSPTSTESEGNIRYHWAHLSPDKPISISVSYEGDGLVASRFSTKTAPISIELQITPASVFVDDHVSVTARIHAAGNNIDDEWLESVWMTDKYADREFKSVPLTFIRESEQWHATSRMEQEGIHTLEIDFSPVPSWGLETLSNTASLIIPVSKPQWTISFTIEPMTATFESPIAMKWAAYRNDVLTDMPGVKSVTALIYPEGAERMFVDMNREKSVWSITTTLDPGTYNISWLWEIDGKIHDIEATPETVHVSVLGTKGPTVTLTPVPVPGLNHTATVLFSATVAPQQPTNPSKSPRPKQIDVETINGPYPEESKTAIRTPTPDYPIVTPTPIVAPNYNTLTVTLDTTHDGQLVGIQIEIDGDIQNVTEGRLVLLKIEEGVTHELTSTAFISSRHSFTMSQPLLNEELWQVVISDESGTRSMSTPRRIPPRYPLWFRAAIMVVVLLLLVFLGIAFALSSRRQLKEVQVELDEMQSELDKLDDDYRKQLTAVTERLQAFEDEFIPDDELDSSIHDEAAFSRALAKTTKSLSEYPYYRRTIPRLGLALAKELEEVENPDDFAGIHEFNTVVSGIDEEQDLAIDVLIHGLIELSKSEKPDLSIVNIIHQQDVSRLILGSPNSIMSILENNWRGDPVAKQWRQWAEWASELNAIREFDIADMHAAVPEGNQTGLVRFTYALSMIQEHLNNAAVESSPPNSRSHSLASLVHQLSLLLRQARSGEIFHLGDVDLDKMPTVCTGFSPILDVMNGNQALGLPPAVRTSIITAIDQLPESLEKQCLEIIVKKVWLLYYA